MKSSHIYPCGRTRREFVWEMGAGFAGLALTSLLEADGFFGRNARAAEPRAGLSTEHGAPAMGPLAPKPAHLPTKARSVIFLMMNGAPSQVDTFDYKPV